MGGGDCNKIAVAIALVFCLNKCMKAFFRPSIQTLHVDVGHRFIYKHTTAQVARHVGSVPVNEWGIGHEDKFFFCIH